MDVFIFFMLFSSIFLHTEAVDTNCPPVKCSHDGPDIMFPFSIQGLQPQDCSYPGFKLLCRENKTMIRFPSYGDLVVKSISYDIRKLSLLDPKNCVPGVFLNLNLSRAPFEYYYVLKGYSYLNCSARLSPSFVRVPCLSGSRHHVYVVDSLLAPVPVSCKLVKTISIPFAYSPYLADNSFGLGFTWELTGRKESWLAGSFNEADGIKVLSMIVFISVVATLVGVKTFFSTSAWVEKLLGHCETLVDAKYSAANVKEPSSRIEAASGSGRSSREFKGMVQDTEHGVCKLESTGIDGKSSMKFPS